MTINELLDKPVWQMTGGKINRAITQIGRKIIVDADLALELAGRKTGGR